MEYISKYILAAKVDVIGEKYRFYKDKNVKYNVSEEFHTDVLY